MNASSSRIYICWMIREAVRNYEGMHKCTDIMRVIGKNNIYRMFHYYRENLE